MSEHNLLNYLAFRQSRGVSVSSLRVSVQALRHRHILSSLDVSVFASHKARLLLQGALRSECSRGKAKARNGITVDKLRRVAAHLHGTGDKFETTLMRSALTLAYHGLLRVSEYTSTAPAKQLTLERIHLSANSTTVDLPFTKICQYGQGTKVTVARTSTFTCSVAALETYLRYRRMTPGVVFTHCTGHPLKAAEVNSLLRVALPGLGISSHSVRIGGATTASKRGVTGQTLRAAGRWKSTACQKYLCFNDDDSRAVSLMIA